MVCLSIIVKCHAQPPNNVRFYIHKSTQSAQSNAAEDPAIWMFVAAHELCLTTRATAENARQRRWVKGFSAWSSKSHLEKADIGQRSLHSSCISSLLYTTWRRAQVRACIYAYQEHISIILRGTCLVFFERVMTIWFIAHQSAKRLTGPIYSTRSRRERYVLVLTYSSKWVPYKHTLYDGDMVYV